MKALIVEDEKMAQARLMHMLEKDYPDIEVVGCTDSVASTVALLATDPPLDVIFMDVELSDGECFEIFLQASVKAQVVMTTAYDTYAVKAFEAGSIDYLLKPIDPEALARAIGRCRERTGPIDIDKLLAAAGYEQRPRYKQSGAIKVGDRLVQITADEVAYIVSEDKYNYVVLLSGEKYILDKTMDLLEEGADPERFFRVGRGCIVSRAAIVECHHHINGRLRLEVRPPYDGDIMVSRARVKSFLSWLG